MDHACNVYSHAQSAAHGRKADAYVEYELTVTSSLPRVLEYTIVLANLALLNAHVEVRAYRASRP